MKRQQRWALAALVACVGIGAAVPQATAADISVAVLGIEADNAQEATATTLTEALRQRVTSAKGFRLVPGRDLVEVKLVFSCPDEAPSCMAQAAKSLGASKLIFGTVKRAAGDDYLVTLKMLDASKGVVEAWAADQVSRAQMSGPAIKGPVQKWFANLTGQGAVGVIRVRSDVVGATVALDGVPVGVTGPEDLVIPGVNAGKHEISATKAGMDTFRDDVELRAGETAQINVVLPQPGSDAATQLGSNATTGADEAPPHPKSTVRTAGWATAGGALLALGLGVKFSLDVKSANSDLDPFRRYDCAAGRCRNSQGQPVDEIPNDPQNPERQQVNRLIDEGNKAQTMQWVSYGAAAALAGVSGYLLYKGYMETEGDGDLAANSRRFTLVPTIAPGAAGGLLQMTF